MARGSLNKVMIIGRLGQDPELKYTPQGVAVCSFTVATNEGFKGQDGNWVDRTEWHRIVLWRGMAETAGKFLRKGSQVYVEGKLSTRSWEKDGQKHYTTEIVGSDMTFLGGKNEGQSQGGGYGQQGGFEPQGGYGQPNTQQAAPQASQQRPQANQQLNQPPAYDIPDTDFDDDDLPF